MLDHFVGGEVNRVSPEAPALVLRVLEEHSMLGGAGNVAANVASLGATAVLVGVIGDDAAGREVHSLIEAQDGGIINALVRSPDHVTTEKTRFIAGDRHLLRADREAVNLHPQSEGQLLQKVRDHIGDCDAVVISDYAKGVVSRGVVEETVREAGKSGVPVIADPKRRDFRLYAGADVLTPNVSELEFATGVDCGDLTGCETAADEVMKLTGSEVVLTRSEHGVAVFQTGHESWSEEAHATVVRDVSGAGDTILAVCALVLAGDAPLQEAAHAANIGAAVAVSKRGTALVTQDELNFALLHSPDTTTLSGKLVTAASAEAVRKMWASQGLQVGLTNGCFDLIHPGHISLLAQASARCDRLIVALNTDSSVRRLKGPERPVQTELARAEVIGSVRTVDLVVLFDEDTPRDLIATLRPDVLIKGADYTVETLVGADLVQEWGGRVELIELVPGASSTNLIEMSRKPPAAEGSPVS